VNRGLKEIHVAFNNNNESKIKFATLKLGDDKEE
jgi:hypothetical protein